MNVVNRMFAREMWLGGQGKKPTDTHTTHVQSTAKRAPVHPLGTPRHIHATFRRAFGFVRSPTNGTQPVPPLFGVPVRGIFGATVAGGKECSGRGLFFENLARTVRTISGFHQIRTHGRTVHGRHFPPTGTTHANVFVALARPLTTKHIFPLQIGQIVRNGTGLRRCVDTRFHFTGFIPTGDLGDIGIFVAEFRMDQISNAQRRKHTGLNVLFTMSGVRQGGFDHTSQQIGSQIAVFVTGPWITIQHYLRKKSSCGVTSGNVGRFGAHAVVRKTSGVVHAHFHRDVGHTRIFQVRHIRRGGFFANQCQDGLVQRQSTVFDQTHDGHRGDGFRHTAAIHEAIRGHGRQLIVRDGTYPKSFVVQDTFGGGHQRQIATTGQFPFGEVVRDDFVQLGVFRDFGLALRQTRRDGDLQPRDWRNDVLVLFVREALPVGGVGLF
jgi:hypothetical protein